MPNTGCLSDFGNCVKNSAALSVSCNTCTHCNCKVERDQRHRVLTENPLIPYVARGILLKSKKLQSSLRAYCLVIGRRFHERQNLKAQHLSRQQNKSIAVPYEVLSRWPQQEGETRKKRHVVVAGNSTHARRMICAMNAMHDCMDGSFFY